MNLPEIVLSYSKFFYACFLKPHSGDNTGNQQDALESFYKAQAAVYDSTRGRLLHGREDMLGLVAAQLIQEDLTPKPVWIDIGGGTGWNIEQMAAYVPVNEFFRAVYLVDLSPSLCDIAKARFARLGWNNVKVVCQDARYFNLAEHEAEAENLLLDEKAVVPRRRTSFYSPGSNNIKPGVDLITMSYALSMIPEFYPVIDSLSSLLSVNGIIGVCDFYVQSRVDYRSRNYTGGVTDRHCNFWSRTFWRTWFDVDRVNLEGARRDYLEYRFGTKLAVNARNSILGVRIPYYIWIGCSKDKPEMENTLAEMDAAATESPFLAALDLQTQNQNQLRRVESFEARSKAYESAIVNLAGKLPLPCFWYQNHHWRIFYDEKLQKHRQFKDEYIYAFTWEDSRIDARTLKINSNDVILAITSAGDNILSYALERPKRIHAVDLNPSQNHLLELKLAAFTALPYSDVWSLFGTGKHPNFRKLLVEKLSPHLSSHAFQHWLLNGDAVFGRKGIGLYYSGGSRHALTLTARLFKLLGLQDEVRRMCNAQTLAEQRDIWKRSLRRVILSRLLSWTVVSSEKWLWKALGVPKQQRDVIEADYVHQADAGKPVSPYSRNYGHAIWEYVVNTLEPVVNETLLRDDNHYYLLCLQGEYTQRCHPDYLKPTSHTKLHAENAFDGLRIHTDEIMEVIERISPGTLTIAVVMDSMDWFDPESEEARKQIRAINRSLAAKGRVLLRSAGLKPWYLAIFEEEGFTGKCVGERIAGRCIDRVNMYASCWLLTKFREVDGEKAMSPLVELSIGDSALN
ncbi:betaine lipid synthase [Tothia fuscella]|uniref:Betaine lipid synthase n=1 Tax=Tothia fuscella TaxID=1048955 RepID=A0A9P4NXB0_9PEZI|nr:betaine lipid synthase [Tothia fuscella]